MIAVIADDFTGAAEIGGIGLRHGLTCVIESNPMLHNQDIDLYIIASDTRTLNSVEASERIAEITKKLLKLKPKFIFKKLDSVLRGNVLDEIKSQLKVSEKSRALIVAANPDFKRIIKDREYFIDDLPLHETCFSTDPDFPITSSNVMEILDSDRFPSLVSKRYDDIIPDTGFIIGDVTSSEEMTAWASNIDADTVYAGGSGFFKALLTQQGFTKKMKNLSCKPFGDKSLFVLGSTFKKEIDFLKKFEEKGHYLSDMPKDIYYSEEFDSSQLENWIKDVIEGIKKHHKVVVSVSHSPKDKTDNSKQIMKNIGELIREVVNRIELNELLIEGGTTTSAILNYLNIEKLIPVQELDTGVIRMEIDKFPNMCLTTKPGSYHWPNNVWVPQDIERFNTIAYD